MYKDPPPVVGAARRQILAIPPHERLFLPSEDLSITALLQLELPSQPLVLAYEKAQTAFTHLPPTESLNAVSMKSRPIPPSDYIKTLWSAFGQAWFDGAQSVVDFRYKQSRLPLYVITYWDEMSRALQHAKSWKRARGWAMSWLSKLDDGEMLREAVGGVLDSLAWGLGLRALGASSTVDSLAKLLSDDWLDDCVIDMLVTDLNLRAPPDSRTEVATLAFVFHVIASYGPKARKDPLAGLLQRYAERARTGELRRLFFPAHLNNNHWVAFLVDFEDESISYG